MRTRSKAQTLEVPRQDDVHWVRRHGSQLEPYAGRWIAVLDGEIIADGASAHEVTRLVAVKGIRGALITLVRPARPVNSFDIA